MITDLQGVVSQVIPFDERDGYMLGAYVFNDDEPVDIICIAPFPETGFLAVRNFMNRLFSLLPIARFDSDFNYRNMCFGPSGSLTVLQSPGHGFSKGDVVEVNVSVTKR